MVPFADAFNHATLGTTLGRNLGCWKPQRRRTVNRVVPAGRMQLGVDNWLVKGLFCFATKGNMDVLSKNTRSTHGMCYGESLYVKGTIHHPCVNYYID